MKKILITLTSVAIVVWSTTLGTTHIAQAYTHTYHAYWRRSFIQQTSTVFQTEPLQSANPELISAAQKTLPSVVTIVGTKQINSSQDQTISAQDILDANPWLQDLGFNSSNMQLQFQSEPQIQVTSGSGFIATHNGYVITNNHVVEDTTESYTATLYDGTQVPATVVYRDPTHDIAVVKIDGTYTTVAPLGDSSNLSVGESIASLGNAYGQYNNSVSLGKISNFNQNINAEGDQSTENLSGIIESSATIVPGYSGGPVVDAQGTVIAINVATGGRASYMIPINVVKSVVSSYLS